MLGQQRLDAVGTESAPMHIGEQGTRSVPHWLLDPCLKDASSVRGKRRASVLPTLSETSHVGTSAQMYSVPIETNQLGETQTCLRREQQQGVTSLGAKSRSATGSRCTADRGIA